jgi:hypothetical protein
MIQQWDGADFQSGVSSLFRPCCEAHMLNCSFRYSGEESFELQLALAMETTATSRPRCTPALRKWIRHPKFLERQNWSSCALNFPIFHLSSVHTLVCAAKNSSSSILLSQLQDRELAVHKVSWMSFLWFNLDLFIHFSATQHNHGTPTQLVRGVWHHAAWLTIIRHPSWWIEQTFPLNG